MEQWIMQLMEQWGYWGILLLILAENLFPPIPSEIILTFGGFLTTTTSLRIGGMITVATLGSTVGAILLYGIGRTFGAERLERIIDKWGGLLRLKREDLHRSRAWFDQYGYWAVLLCRFVPLIRSLISIPAGLSQMRMLPFIALTALGSLIWNGVLIALGAGLGHSWESILAYLEIYANVVYVSLAAGIVGFLLYRFKRVKRRGEQSRK